MMKNCVVERRWIPWSSSLPLLSMEGREQSSGDCVRALEVGGTRWQTNDEEVKVNAADMCRRTVAHATTDKTSLSMRPLTSDLG